GLMADLIRRTVRARGAHLHQESAVLDGLRAFGRRCAYREEHAEQVAHLSLSLFDQLPDLHRLGEEERALLHAAAMLHDVGAFVSYNRHHKHTYYLLYHADLPGFTDRERELIATIARYHRRSPPKDRHAEFQRLTPDERIVVRRLAARFHLHQSADPRGADGGNPRERSEGVRGRRDRRAAARWRHRQVARRGRPAGEGRAGCRAGGSRSADVAPGRGARRGGENR